MTRRNRLALIGAVAIAAAVGGVVLHRSLAPVSADGSALERLVQQQFRDLEGTPRALTEWKGKVLVVNFWATWCPPCREEIPGLIELHRKLSPTGVQVVGIAIDSVDKVRPFARDLGINYPVLIGDAEVIGALRPLGNKAGALPYTLILDRTGAPAAKHLGLLTPAELETLVAAAR